MSAAFEPPQLRPLGLGEIFDRAVTLYVRNFVLFALITLTIVLPFAIMQYVTAPSNLTFTQILSQVQAEKSPQAQRPQQSQPKNQPPARLPPLPAKEIWLFLIAIVLALVLTPFIYLASAFAVHDLYNGRPPNWSSAYRQAIRHASGVFGLLFFEIVIGGAVGFFGVIGITIFAAVTVLLTRGVPIASAVAEVVAFALVAALVIVFLLCYLAFTMALYGLAIENKNVLEAVGGGFRRIFSRREFWRSTLMVLALFAVYIAQMILAMFAASIFEGLLHVPVLESVVGGLISIVTTAFLTVLIAVYYFDLRIRHEGLDVESMVDRLETQAAT